MNEREVRNTLAAIDRNAEPERTAYLESMLVRAGLPITEEFGPEHYRNGRPNVRRQRALERYGRRVYDYDRD